jgi:fructose-bisphosphate aldolase class I
MLKLSIPVVANFYRELIGHPKVLAVVALSGGYSTDEACAKLTENQGIIASFSRGLLQDLRARQSDEEFDRTLGAAIDQIHLASIR